MNPEIKRLEDILSEFDVTPSNFEKTKSLQRRTDTKFILNTNDLYSILPSLKDNYALLLSNGKFYALYKTQYFDSRDLSLFKDHRNGRRIRYKVRIREYVDRGLSFLEIKKRRSDIEQVKIRKKHQFDNFSLSDEDKDFISDQTGYDDIFNPSVLMSYFRITLLNKKDNERVTVDLNLKVESSGKIKIFDHLAIIEVKQWPFKRYTAIMDVLKLSHIQSKKISKYCNAIALTNSNLLYNRLIPRVNNIKEFVL